MSLITPSELRGQHAMFSPSKVSWINYTDEEFIKAYHTSFRSEIGTIIHFWAGIQIQLGQKCASARDAVKSIKTLIFESNFSERYGLSNRGQKLISEIKHIPSEVFSTVKQYVNDSIDIGMEPETEIIFSDDFKGTCDALRFDDKNKELLIFDLKTGTGKGKIEQLMIYEALWCLANKVDPIDISAELRIYQGDQVMIATPTAEDIDPLMKTIVRFNRLSMKLGKGGAL